MSRTWYYSLINEIAMKKDLSKAAEKKRARGSQTTPATWGDQ